MATGLPSGEKKISIRFFATFIYDLPFPAQAQALKVLLSVIFKKYRNVVVRYLKHLLGSYIPFFFFLQSSFILDIDRFPFLDCNYVF